MEPEAWLADQRTKVEARLAEVLPAPGAQPANLSNAMRSAVLSGGKRLRPLLTLASALAAGGDPAQALDAGCATELVHCFSLVHDDLPSIDNDDLRRGRPTLHRQFNEATAILAGDALFALAFETVATIPEPVTASRCLLSLARAAGSQGLVGGEVMDVEGEGKQPVLEEVETIHKLKTGALISCACELGGLASGADPAHVDSLRKFGAGLGLAFQIVDDVLNETSSAETLGKAAGSDRSKSKLTYPAAVGVCASKQMAQSALDAVLPLLGGLSGDVGPLRCLAVSCVVRES